MLVRLPGSGYLRPRTRVNLELCMLNILPVCLLSRALRPKLSPFHLCVLFHHYRYVQQLDYT